MNDLRQIVLMVGIILAMTLLPWVIRAVHLLGSLACDWLEERRKI